jgi:hypothetical protein
MSNYSYSNTSDFVNATVIKPSEVYENILASNISSANVLYGNVVGDAVTFYFDAALSGADVTTLNGIVTNYVNSIDGIALTTNSINQISNKNLLVDSNFFVDPIDNTKQLGFSAASATTGSTLTLGSAITGDRTITFPDISDIVVTLGAVQSLTNKTLTNPGIYGIGSSTASSSTLYVQPSSTVLTNADYYFGYFGSPTTTGSTTGSAYTMYIEGAPSGTITTPYSMYVAAGKTYIGGALQIPSGAATNYVLASDSVGNASWVSLTTIPKPFNDGNVSTPTITFINETTTGLYRAGAGQLGITLSGVGSVLFKSAGVDFTTGQTINVGTSGVTSPLNVYGLVTSLGGLSVSGATALFSGGGFTSAGSASLSISPTSTAVSGSSNYYFTALTIPTTTGSTSGSAYTFYIQGAPTGTITTPYAAYIAGGKTYIGGALQIVNGASNGYVLTSDASGNASWTSLTASTTFADGTVTAPSITFTSDTNTGLYIIGTDNMGIAIGGTKTVDLSTTQTQVLTDLKTSGGFSRNATANAGTGVILSTSDNFVEFTSSSNVIVTLPTIVGNAGREYTIVQAGSGNITINTASGSEFIDNGVLTSVSLNSIYSKITLVCGQSQWYSL